MICAIVPAAGRSRRMGVQKLLLPFGETSVIGHVADQLLRSVVDEVYVVVGDDGPRIAGELSGRAVAIVTNPHCEAGMLSSLRCGLRALPPSCEAVMVALGDQPGIRRELVDDMVQSFATTDKMILAPTYRGRRGHPILFSQHYRQEILTHYDDVGLRGLLHARADDVFELSVTAPEVLSDMDCAEDYRRELALLRRRLRSGR